MWQELFRFLAEWKSRVRPKRVHLQCENPTRWQRTIITSVSWSSVDFFCSQQIDFNRGTKSKRPPPFFTVLRLAWEHFAALSRPLAEPTGVCRRPGTALHWRVLRMWVDHARNHIICRSSHAQRTRVGPGTLSISQHMEYPLMVWGFDSLYSVHVWVSASVQFVQLLRCLNHTSTTLSKTKLREELRVG